MRGELLRKKLIEFNSIKMPPKFITRKTLVEKATDGTYSQGRRITPRDPSFKENVLKAYLEEFSITEVEITVDTYIKFDKV